MADKPYLWIVFVRLPAELEDKFERWYDDVHVPLVTAGGHFSSITRYRMTDAFPSDLSKYIAVCEFRDEDIFRQWLVSDARAEAARDTAATWAGTDMEFMPKAFYEPYRSYELPGRTPA
jgi:antibiotic biosynthesis monooxygenase (ABM) superfamily enzyme